MLSFTTDARDTGKRLDHYVQEHVNDVSRSRLQNWIKDSRVLVNGAPSKASHVLRAGETVEISPADPPPLEARLRICPLRFFTKMLP